MRKILVVASLGFALLFAVGPNEHEAEAQKQAQSVPEPSIAVSNDSAEQEKQNCPSQESPEPYAGIEWSNWVLVLIAGATGWAVWKQAQESAKATKSMSRQADLMKEQSDLATEKDRAKLRIELDSSGPIKDEFGAFNVHGLLSIYGNSEAFIRHSEIYASIGPGGIFNPLPEWTWRIHNVPEVIRPNAEPMRFTVMVMSDSGPAEDAEMTPVYKKETEIHCMARIEFSDAYGRVWNLRVRRRFVFAWHQGIGGYLGGTWEDSGPWADNGEYRTEEKPKNQK